MSKNLVIVESPAKAKTIEKYLGKDYIVESSFGHISDLSKGKNGMGIDIENNFIPEYEISEDKKAVVKKLKTLSKKVNTVWLASDEDREGEAIAWHLYNFLDLKNKETKRIVFNEITKKAILKAIENPRSIDTDLVNAQQARRVLDRLVGFELSPVLWRKVRRGLSAGRVQSVAVRLIVEREEEIRNYKPKISFKVIGEFYTEDAVLISAELKEKITKKEEVLKLFNTLLNANFKVQDLVKKPGYKSPQAPFTTSTLQQEASAKLGYSVSATMQLAQRLYESGHITYMRTDSVNLSNDAKSAIKDEILASYGKEYYHSRDYKNKNKGAQEAHEAIRPTEMKISKIGNDDRQEKLYHLIWRRTMASQMANAQTERTTISIENTNNESIFQSKGEIITFDGFLRLYQSLGVKDVILPSVKVGELLQSNGVTAEEKFSRASSRFTEASLVRQLEELGIGRPSTYAPTISTIQRREYVEKGEKEGVEKSYNYITLKEKAIEVEEGILLYGADRNKLMPTEIGTLVNDFLVNHFSTVLDYSFTANVEATFDAISEGKKDWNTVIGDFYNTFHPKIEEVLEHAERASGERILGEDPKTGEVIKVRMGRFGPMAQIGETIDDKKARYVGLQKNMLLAEVTLEQVLPLFELPIYLGDYEELPIEVSEGRYGPYVKYDEKFISLPKGLTPFNVDIEEAIAAIEEKRKADAPIAYYKELPVQKGVGRFGPFLKWNGLFINVNKKYNFDNLLQEEIEFLIEDKLQKERDKVIHNWEKEGIQVLKARWGRFNIVKGKTKIELPKTTKVEEFTLEDVQKIIEEKVPKKKVVKRKITKKKTTKKK